MVSLDVAVVVLGWSVGRVKVDKIEAERIEVEHVRLYDAARPTAIEYYGVVLRHGLNEVLPERQAQVSPAVVVTLVGERERPHPCARFACRLNPSDPPEPADFHTCQPPLTPV